ncbi:type II toxin-antitoxin system ParD family antitoxin [Planctomicrobium piriforme]|uniref:Putative addiction module antidote protein, CC2985 family n=1 Tax=Planctomicrobium piriforme TaxID=1576369 RepID=A0A1I3J7N4_9PLAN|nr:type II toxin-antitoxin system ParD family antitoxin [Planctomicrobium piriforme]SFI56183.1 putative addiction module antidote protein, CC2985 family [Planctomicrobium piriforme]
MVITLPKELEQFVAREIAAGKFRSNEEAVAEALWLLRSREERLDGLRADLQLGIDQMANGERILIDSPEAKDGLLADIERRACSELGFSVSGSIN